MDTISPYRHEEAKADNLRQLEGMDRVPLLEFAVFLALTVGSEYGDPVVVFIGWRDDLVERAYPGTAIWRAALQRYLAGPHAGDPAEPLVRAAAEESLRRFVDLQQWIKWNDRERPPLAERPRRKRRRFWMSQRDDRKRTL